MVTVVQTGLRGEPPKKSGIGGDKKTAGGERGGSPGGQQGSDAVSSLTLAVTKVERLVTDFRAMVHKEFSQDSDTLLHGDDTDHGISSWGMHLSIEAEAQLTTARVILPVRRAAWRVECGGLPSRLVTYDRETDAATAWRQSPVMQYVAICFRAGERV